MPKCRTSAVIIAVAQSTLSKTLPAGESLDREYAVNLQGGDGIKEGSPDPPDEDNNAQEPQGGGFHA